MKKKCQGGGNLPISPVMRKVSAYIATALKKPLPAKVTEMTKHHLLDTLAAMVSGSRLLPGEARARLHQGAGRREEACVPGSRIVTTVVNAALAGGMLAHADETDDSHAPSLTHPGCGIVPAALAMAEREQAGGTALLRAVALGYDIGTRLSPALGGYAFSEAGHDTHAFGPMFGAAAAAGALARPRRRPGAPHALLHGPAGVRASRTTRATPSTSRKRSSSAACRRATAPRPRRWSPPA